MASKPLSTRKKLAFSAIVLVFFLTLGEVAIRGWVYYLREDYTRYETATGMPYLVPGTHGADWSPIVINSDGLVGKELRENTPSLFRVVSLGDSNTFGGGSIEFAYPARLGFLLEERDGPERQYEVINAGIEGMDSHQALYRLRNKVLDLDPDVVVIYIGWNDLMKYDPLGQSGGGAVSAISRTMDRLWLVKGIRKFIFFYARPRLDPPLTGPESFTGRFDGFRPGTYIENVRTMIREIRAAGAVPILMNLTTVVRPDFTRQDVIDAAVYMPYYPSGYAVGDFLDLVDAYNAAVDEISTADSVPVVDLHGFFLSRPDFRALFYDTMHPTTDGYLMVAQNVLAVLDEHVFEAGDAATLHPATDPTATADRN